MRIAVLSGKGGTGKTTVAASLALVTANSQYIDCDVEEPNGFLYLKPKFSRSSVVKVRVPQIDESICTHCGACARICQFNALAVTPKRVLAFSELCHHCGACSLVCEAGAITEVDRRIGVIEADAIGFAVQGRLDVGEPVGIPILDDLKIWIEPGRTAILDCPPGASCSVVHSLEDCDFAILVTEPTPFGLHDLKIAAELVKTMGIPAGIVLNKAGKNNSIIEAFCAENNLPILIKIPYSRKIAADYSNGILPVQASSEWAYLFGELAAKLSGLAQGVKP
ncbi:MAG: (4Fe-4S)-binding protein [Clostridia bacterium]|nr:(4Fe-4S)-binding protein [Clostridia bacterium]